MSSRPERGSARGGFGRAGFGRGRGRAGRGRPSQRRTKEPVEWKPVTNLGKLVKSGSIRSIDEIFAHSLRICEHQIVDTLLPAKVLKDEVMKIMPVQKQTRAGQRTRFKALVVVGDNNGHIGLGVKVAREVATAIAGALICAKLAIIPVRMGYWSSVFGDPHTVPMKVSGRYSSVEVRLIPAPRGSRIVAAPTPKKMIDLAGIKDCYTGSRGRTCTTFNFAHATFEALSKTYSYLSPDLWAITDLPPSPIDEYHDVLATLATPF